MVERRGMMVEKVRRSSVYAVYRGVDYVAFDGGELVTLRIIGSDPVPEGFNASPITGVAAQLSVPRSDLDRMYRLTTLCRWQGEPFYVRAVKDGILYVTYDGEHGEWACKQPGMERTDKFVTEGQIGIDEVTDITETVEELPL